MGKSSAPAYDYSAFEDEKKVSPSDNILVRLNAMALLQAQVEARVAKLEQDLKEAKEHHRLISETQLPDLMEEAEMLKFSTLDGLEIAIKEVIRGSIPKATQEVAFAWLEDHGHGKLIKREFKIDFGKDEDKWADKFERDLAKRKKPLNVKRKKAVHPQSLQAFVRTQLEEGVAIPMDTFGVHRQRFSKVEVK